MTSRPPALPSPTDRPDTDVVIYDGECGICEAHVSKLPWWDCEHRLSYLSLHERQVAERWPQLPPERLLQEMCIVDTQGREHWGPEAIRYLTRRLRRLWWLFPVLHLPGIMFIWQPLYRWVANNRYRLSGAKICDADACELRR